MFAAAGCGIAPVGVAGFSAVRALSRRNDDPARASRPFDAERDRFVMGEAAGVDRARGAAACAGARREGYYADLIGYGLLVGRTAHHGARCERPPAPARAMVHGRPCGSLG